MSYQEFRISSWDIRLGIRLSHGDIPNVMDSHWADQEMPVIHSISFDSTEEELVVTAPSAAATSAEAATSSTTTATAAPSGGGAKAGGHSAAGVSLCPTSAMKRQSYRNMLDSRFNKTSFNTLQYPSSPTTAARTHRSLSPVAAALATVVQSSFDSIDTVETSASSTDASRFGHVTTSFESSATVDTTTDEATTGPYAIKGPVMRLFHRVHREQCSKKRAKKNEERNRKLLFYWMI